MDSTICLFSEWLGSINALMTQATGTTHREKALPQHLDTPAVDLIDLGNHLTIEHHTKYSVLNHQRLLHFRFELT